MGLLLRVKFGRRPSGRESPLPSFGNKLKLEREKRAITLEEISLSTKIGTRMLRALEEEKFDQLPGGIFNRGFVRAYARHVGLDEDQAIADYLDASGDRPANADTVMEAEIAPPESREPTPSRQLPWGLLAAVLLLLALALALSFWSRWRHKNEGQQPVQPATTQSPAMNPATGPSTGSVASLASKDRANTVQTSSPVSEVDRVNPASVGGKNNNVVAAAEIGPAPGEFTVVILARDDSWLTITADGKTIFEGTLLAENQRAVHGQKEVVIRAGNTGALDFVLNGKKLPLQGDYGEVKTLTFGSGGLQSNTPAPAVTQ
jgi:cytoskeletal protein RodZ